MFCFFKNINIKCNKFINEISSATFAVFLIHSSSPSMRVFLWEHLLNIKGHYCDKFLFVYAIVCVLLVYAICILIDLMRIRFIEKPLFNKLSKNEGYTAICCKIDGILN